jgi:asparagine synthase (glutamine-hydrolysing)
MCGIAGIVRFDGLAPGDRPLLTSLAAQLWHRGPDGEGFHVSSHAAIASRRLAIVDVPGGAQPLYNEDRTIALVANGEIYNHLELRRDLEARGHRFSTHSDCETIVHLYEDEGLECVAKLRGMFAFAIADERTGRVMIARDRMGEKPLYVVERPDALVFSSELGALVATGVVPFEIDYDAVKAYYHWNFLPEPLSAVRGVRRLPAATLMDIEPRRRRIQERVYWRLEDAPPLHDEPIERIRREIHSIGGIIAGADVPVGVTLSGGIDSSAVLALAARQRDGDVTAFSVGYEGYAWQDERAQAAEFAAHVGVPVHELRLRVEDVVRGYPAMVLSRGEPVSDMSGSAWLEMGRLAREHGVKVLLTGSGGDELFWGYPWLRAAVVASRRKCRLLGGEASVLDYLTARRPPPSVTGLLYWTQDAAGLLHGVRGWRRDRRTPPDQIVFWDDRQEFRDAESLLPRYAGPALREATASPAALFRGTNLWSDLETSMTVLNCATYLRSNGLLLCDRMPMAASVECRAPLVDYRLAETVVGLRKVHSDFPLGHKGWLKAAVSDLVPPFVLQRRKRGFSPPWRSWTRALMGKYAGDMADGILVERGVIERRAAERFRSGFDRVGRQMPLAQATLDLEFWARGLAGLEANSRTSSGERRLA